MRTCVLTFFGQGDERDERLGLPVPFYRYLIIASDMPGYSVASVTALFGQGPEPNQIHYPVENGGVDAAIDAAVADLSQLPKLNGLQVKRDDER
ncbi:MAG: hypothetical protein WAM82_36120 [Thermoanaerobaculia bacterium]